MAIKEKRAKRSKKIIQKDRILTIMCIPGILHGLIFSYIPLMGIVIAFQFYKPAYGFVYSPFVGFDNFMFLLKSITFARITTNAIALRILGTIFGTVTGVLFGVFLFEVN